MLQLFCFLWVVKLTLFEFRQFFIFIFLMELGGVICLQHKMPLKKKAKST